MRRFAARKRNDARRIDPAWDENGAGWTSGVPGRKLRRGRRIRLTTHCIKKKENGQEAPTKERVFHEKAVASRLKQKKTLEFKNRRDFLTATKKATVESRRVVLAEIKKMGDVGFEPATFWV